MYLPDHFRVEDIPEMHALMRARPFAALISAGPEGLYASHLPTVLKDGDSRGAHRVPSVARQSALEDSRRGQRSDDDLPGARGLHHAQLVSLKAAAWKGRAHLELCGGACVRPSRGDEGTDWLLRHVGELTAQQERSEAQPWAVSDAPDSYIEAMLRGIVGFRFAITRLEGKWKMSQNREVPDRLGVVEGLRTRAAGDDIEIADAVSRKIPSGD